MRELISRNLAAFQPRLAGETTASAAAVVVAISESPTKDGEPAILLTLRASHLSRHGGQFALPGGRLDEGETATNAALRELAEELGVHLGPSDVLGRLDDFITRSGYCISPFVVWAGQVSGQLVADPNEVAEIYEIPFSHLTGEDFLEMRNDRASGDEIAALYMPVLGHHIYPPTAAIIYQFREVALLGRNTKVAHFEQPAFARK